MLGGKGRISEMKADKNNSKRKKKWSRGRGQLSLSDLLHENGFIQ